MRNHTNWRDSPSPSESKPPKSETEAKTNIKAPVYPEQLGTESHLYSW